MCFVPLSVESLLVCCACCCCFCCCLTDLVSVFGCYVCLRRCQGNCIRTTLHLHLYCSTALPARDTPHCTSAPPQAAVEMPQNVQLSVYAATLCPSTSLPLSLPHSLSPSVDLPALSAIWDSVEVFGLGGVGYVGFHLENTSKLPIASPPTYPLAAARTLRHFCNRNPNHTQIAITSICFDCPPSGGWRRSFVFNCFH